MIGIATYRRTGGEVRQTMVSVSRTPSGATATAWGVPYIGACEVFALGLTQEGTVTDQRAPLRLHVRSVASGSGTDTLASPGGAPVPAAGLRETS